MRAGANAFARGFSRPACVDLALHRHQPADRLTAVHDQGLTRDLRGYARAEKQHHTGHLLGNILEFAASGLRWDSRTVGGLAGKENTGDVSAVHGVHLRGG